jgi:predicted transcriptional regulator with HTH domain
MHIPKPVAILHMCLKFRRFLLFYKYPIYDIGSEFSETAQKMPPDNKNLRGMD